MNHRPIQERETSISDRFNFIMSAINDVSGNIRLIDTKVALIATAIGVITSTLVSIRSNIYHMYMDQNTCGILLNLILVSYAISCLISVIASILCLFPRKSIGKHNSIWFFSPKQWKYRFPNYYRSLTNRGDMLKELSYQLYILNSINTKKLFWAKLALTFFAMSFIIAFFLAILLAIYYLIQMR